ncbi:MAG TPA: DUF932 domain-containing protein [Candidatus Polarisedimenticolaceae bacterium]|nr:DUF932 domain-containing protein [Candidatus Polarisedimenticolaceae bacterium]
MSRAPVDLSAHINQDVTRGHPADFPVSMVRLYRQDGGRYEQIPRRLAVARLDTGTVLAVVSERYRLIRHQAILDLVEQAIQTIDLGSVPRGVFVDRGGARLRAIYKFPALAKLVRGYGEICPCLKIQNSYDGRSRIAIHIGAFRFVCTNLAVGGGGVFAGGLVSVHAGEIPLEELSSQLVSYLEAFEAIVFLYSEWAERGIATEILSAVLDEMPSVAAAQLRQRFELGGVRTILDAYDAATDYATHRMGSIQAAFDLLARVNRSFQVHAPSTAGSTSLATDRTLTAI